MPQQWPINSFSVLSKVFPDGILDRIFNERFRKSEKVEKMRKV